MFHCDRFFNLLRYFYLGVFLSGCDSLSDGIGPIFDGIKEALSFKQGNVWLQKIIFKASSDVNDSSPVSVHLVVAYTDELWTELKKMAARDYFQQNQTLANNYQKDIEILTFDIVKDERLEAPIHLKGTGAKGAVLFAHYSSDGVHRFIVGSATELNVLLNKTDFTIQSNNSSSN
jgi:hypothetical protein